MPDREKVIKGLECCMGYGIEDTPGCEDCPYNDMGDTCERIRPLYEDALALLKAQEPREMSDAELMDAIRKAPIIVKPTVDAAPVKCGQWTERHVDYASDCAIDEVQTAKCSVCGLYHTTPYLYSFTDFKFCPNCGAKMNGVRTWEP